MNLAALKSIKPSKAWLVLAVAIVIGAIAAFAASRFLSGRLADIEARSQGKTVKAVVAKRDLHRGDRLSSENVAVRAIPFDYAQSGAVVPEQFGSVEGEPIAYDLRAGEMLMWSQMEGKKAPTFSARIESGRRAITVPVDEINSISGLLEPGDLIDLLVTLDRHGKKVTAPLLTGVRVMATGQRSADDPKSGERRLYSTVTLNTDPQEAQTVVLAREAGRLTALLRNPQDGAPLPGGTADMAALFGTEKAALAGADPELSAVPVLYGGAGGRIPPEGLYLGQYVKAKSAEQPPARLSDVGAASAALASMAAHAPRADGATAQAEPLARETREVPVLVGGGAPRRD